MAEFANRAGGLLGMATYVLGAVVLGPSLVALAISVFAAALMVLS